MVEAGTVGLCRDNVPMTREGFETIRDDIFLAAKLAEYLDFQATGESIPCLIPP
jgi:hypothetical protein